MDFLYLFFIRNDVWIYILSALGIVWYLSELIKARAILRRAVFGLEHERGQRLQTKALTFLALFGSLIGLVAYVNLQVAPSLPPELLRPPTPTPNIFATPLSSPTPLGSPQPDQPTPTPPIAPTVTLARPAGGGPAAPQPVPISTPLLGSEAPPGGNDGTQPGETEPPAAPPPAAAVGCSPNVNITSPASGSTVSGSVSFFGTATDAAFAFYKLEASGPETGGIWASTIGGTVEQPVVNGQLGSAIMGGWQPGTYSFRLTVVDLTSNEVGQCIIQLAVE
jgi:hypothetical protein